MLLIFTMEELIGDTEHEVLYFLYVLHFSMTVVL